MKKKILIIVSISFIFISCSRNIYNNSISRQERQEKSKYVVDTNAPPALIRGSDISSLSLRKGVYRNVKYYDGTISIDPNDTITINKYSLTENFTVTDIEKKKGYYNISVQSDSIQNIFDSDSNIIYSFRIGYQIISLKTSNIKISKKIQKGQQYTLTLIPNVMFLGNPCTILSHRVLYVFTKGKYIAIVSASNIYTTPNLDGLYYTLTQKSK